MTTRNYKNFQFSFRFCSFIANKRHFLMSITIRANFGLSWTWREKAWFSPRRFLQYNLLGVSCGHDFLSTQRIRLSGLPRYLERVRETYKNFSKDIWIKVSTQNMSFLLEYFDLTLSFIFQISIFLTFPDILSDGCVVRSQFIYWRKYLG